MAGDRADSFDEHTHFHEVVDGLVQSHALDPYEQKQTFPISPKGEFKYQSSGETVNRFRPDFDPVEQHYLDHRLTKPGEIAHLGDEPYSTAAVAFGSMDEPETEGGEYTLEAVQARRQSMMKAINAYMPPKTFPRFLQHYVDGMCESGTRDDALTETLNVYYERIKNKQENQQDPKRDASEDDKRWPARKPFFLSNKSYVPFLMKNPELVLSLALFSSGHIEHINKTWDMIDEFSESGQISEQQQDVAADVLMHTFENFRENILPDILFPLIYNKASKQQVHSSQPPSARQALHDALEAVNQQEMFMTDIDGTGQVATCPFRVHFSRLQRAESPARLEDIYDKICANRETLKPILSNISLHLGVINKELLAEQRAQQRDALRDGRS
ncbi:MAG: hypothetical protein MRY32_03740 [Rickettsiales bacterium]|nr:hypothetical protein [Rickettsiales bacterium]